MSTLEFDLHPEDAWRLLRAASLRPRAADGQALGVAREGRVAASALRIVWHDTPDSDLARKGLAVAEGRDGWSLERMRPGAAEWAPATPPPVVVRRDSAAGLASDLARIGVEAGLMPVAAFEGVRRIARLSGAGAGARMEVLDGVVRAVAAEQPACLCRLTGDPDAIHDLAVALAATLRLGVPRHSLSCRGRSLARGEAPPPRRLGCPGVAPGQSVGEALGAIISHLVDVILHWIALIPGPDAETAVHQTRVAVRRLRSALSLFSRAFEGSARGLVLDQAREVLRDLAARLGPARDWDVFLGGTGQDLAAGFAGEPRIAALLAAGERRRRAEHAALRAWLARPEQRRTEVALACLAALRPWQPPISLDPEPAPSMEQSEPQEAVEPAPPDRLAEPCRDYARRMLARRHRRMMQDGRDLAALDIPALHELRKDGKRLRYACEFFGPLFGGKATRRFGKRMEPLQEALGFLNDAAVAASLVEQLGTGPARGFAAGAVQGFVAGRTGKLRRRIEETWDAFRDADPFWE